MSNGIGRRGFLQGAGAVVALTAFGRVLLERSVSAATPMLFASRGNLQTDGTIANLPPSFYDRPGLEGMPVIDYASMPVENIADHGAVGDGVTDCKPAFNAAVTALQAVGGGIVYVPEGQWLFAPAPAPAPSWWSKTLQHIHFVGEGDGSQLCFERPSMVTVGVEAPPRPSGNAWELLGVDDLSIRDLRFSWTPHAMARHTTTAAGVLMRAPKNAQVLRVTVEQVQPGIVLPDATNCWMVENTVLNSGSDALNFGGANACVAAYNYIENITDDGLANFTNTSKYPDTTLISDVLFAHNTIIGVAYGRGLTLGGNRQTVSDNWVETGVASGIYSDVGIGVPGLPPGVLRNAVVTGNTVVRCNYEHRPDNRGYSPGGGYHGSIAMRDEIDGLTINNNRVVGSEVHDLVLGIDNWRSTHTVNAQVSGNELRGARGSGIRVRPGAVIEGIAMDDNVITGASGPSVSIAGSLVDATTSGNEVTSAPEVTGTVTGDFSGFTIVGDPEPYVDAYRAVRDEGQAAAWTEPVTPDITGLPSENVRDHGALGNGGADDTAAFYAALDALPSTGGILFVPEGNYQLTAGHELSTFRDTRIRHHFAVTERPNIHLVGEGDKSVIRLTDARAQGIRFIASHGSSVRDIQIRQQAMPGQRTNRALLDLSGQIGGAVERVKLAQSGGFGLLIDASTNVRVASLEAAKCLVYGVQVQGSRLVRVTESLIWDCQDAGLSLSWFGTVAREAHLIRVSENTIRDITNGAGIAIDSAADVVIESNVIKSTRLAGIHVYARCPMFPLYSLDITGNDLRNVNSGPTYTPGAISFQSVRETKGTAAGTITIASNRIRTTPFAGVWVGGNSPIGTVLSELNSFTVNGNAYSELGGAEVSISSAQQAKIVTLTVT